ncbi:SIS domain-containing protein [Streptomyces sp. NPDC093109]|uniref:SIS domain-containing protein n=1 Tax=Streptomyces sp. NPDC093109 TaxID=3154977 RepID=UPI00344FE0CB
MSAAYPEDGPVEWPGRLMSAEVTEQPAVLRRILQDGEPRIREVAAVIAARKPRFALLAARGTSGHAALYGKYLLEIRRGLPCGLASMSTTTTYGAHPDLTGVLFVAVSQWGGSPDLVASTWAAREAGAITVALTNNPDSSLAAVSEFHIDVLAGPERALPATKSYTASLLSLYLFVAALGGGELGGPHDDRPSLAPLPDLAEEIVARREEIRTLAARYRFAERVVVTSRGYSYPTAQEAALKLMETCYLPALAFSGADMLHGPLAMVGDTSAVIAVVPDGKGGEALRPVLDRLRSRGADLFVIGTEAEVRRASTGFVLPTRGVPERLQPILEILPLHLLAYELALARGHDPDVPRAMAKTPESR